MTSEVNITRMDAFTYRSLIKGGKTPVLVPLGSVEQHGPHMPLSVDSLLATKLSELTAQEVGALVGPTVSNGFKSQQRNGGGYHIIGTIGFDGDALVSICRTLVREFSRHGVQYLSFVNGHYENTQFLYEGVDLGLRDVRAAGTVMPRVMMMSYWDFVTEAVIEQLYPDGFPGWAVEHGGVMETALMLEYYPELVHMDRAVDHPQANLPVYDLLPADPSWTPDSGCLSSGVRATAEMGRTLARSIIDGMSGALREAFPRQ